MSNGLEWTVPQEMIPLPSSGLIYSPDTVLYGKETLQIKAMTAQEEDILTSNAFIKEGTVIKNLVKSCLIDKDVDVDDLIVGDRNALMVSIRITGYGKDYNVNHTCEKCQSYQKVTADLSTLGIKRFKVEPVEKGKNLFEFNLPVTKKKVLFKYKTGHDENEIKIKEERLKAIGIQSNNLVTQTLKDAIVSIDGITNRTEIDNFVRNMPALDSRNLRQFIKENEPGLDMSCDYNCASCGHTNSFALPITAEFFWPST